MSEVSAFHSLSTKQLRALKNKAEKAEQRTVKKPSKKELIKQMEDNYDLHETPDGYDLKRRSQVHQASTKSPKATSQLAPVAKGRTQEEMIEAIYRKLNN